MPYCLRPRTIPRHDARGSPDCNRAFFVPLFRSGKRGGGYDRAAPSRSVGPPGLDRGGTRTAHELLTAAGGGPAAWSRPDPARSGCSNTGERGGVGGRVSDSTLAGQTTSRQRVTQPHPPARSLIASANMGEIGLPPETCAVTWFGRSCRRPRHSGTAARDGGAQSQPQRSGREAASPDRHLQRRRRRRRRDVRQGAGVPVRTGCSRLQPR